MKSYKPSPAFKFLVCAAFALFFGALGHHYYKRITTDRHLIKHILTNHKDTEHFHIYSNLDTEQMDYYEQFFEGFYEYFDREYFEIRQNKPLKVFLFKDLDSYTWYAKRVGARTTYGFYMGPRENIIVVNRESGLGTVTHELVHHFIVTSFEKKPAKWVEEGIATFFEKFIGHLDSEGNLDISFGYFSNWRFPLTKMCVEVFDLHDMIRSKKPDQCAARSFMLFLNKKGLFKDFVREISKAKDDPDGSTTLQKVYGTSITSIELEWKEWIKMQPINEDVSLVSSAFVLTEGEWYNWWRTNQDRLYWSEEEQLFRVKK